ncbi:MAG: type I methionyl aminopeptidase [Paludibacteraceae bacterium]|nr:type I methionyl aminopeptidase [Paludibacteraceae bacterium]
MIYLKTDEEVELMRESNLIVARTLAEVAKHIREGVTTLQLDSVAEKFIRSCGAYPSFLGYEGFPNSICVSVNDQVVHGIPSTYALKRGDVVSVDCGAVKNGFHGDSCYTFFVGEISEEAKRLLDITKESLYKGIEMAVEGNRIGDIGCAIQTHCESAGFSVVREMVGHGIGRSMHEQPKVPNYGKSGFGDVLKNGMVIAIEPMVNSGSRYIRIDDDGWTARTVDGSWAAHYEHTVVVRKGKADILSSFEYIDQVLGKT